MLPAPVLQAQAAADLSGGPRKWMRCPGGVFRVKGESYQFRSLPPCHFTSVLAPAHAAPNRLLYRRVAQIPMQAYTT